MNTPVRAGSASAVARRVKMEGWSHDVFQKFHRLSGKCLIVRCTFFKFSYIYIYHIPGARTLLGAPDLTTRNEKLLGGKGIATRSKDATRRWWP